MVAVRERALGHLVRNVRKTAVLGRHVGYEFKIRYSVLSAFIANAETENWLIGKLSRTGPDPIETGNIIQKRSGQGKQQAYGDPAESRPWIAFVYQRVASCERSQNQMDKYKNPLGLMHRSDSVSRKWFGY